VYSRSEFDILEAQEALIVGGKWNSSRTSYYYIDHTRFRHRHNNTATTILVITSVELTHQSFVSAQTTCWSSSARTKKSI